ncbi:hypothetical protein N9Q58_04220 [Polaribacter sp.]|nr:hypothetical protein [Polaribacter sp.]
MKIESFKVIELEEGSLININGGGERYARFFGKFVRRTLFSTLGLFGGITNALLDGHI